MEFVAPIIFAIIFFLILFSGAAFWLYMAIVPQKSPFEKGLDAFAEQDYEQAKKMFRTALTEAPDNIEIIYNLGLTLCAAQDYGEAIKCFEDILLLDRENLEALYNIGIVFFKKGDYDNAKKKFEEVLSKNPNEIDSLFNLGLTYQMQKNYEEAQNLYAKVLELNPNDADCYFNLSIIKFEQKEYQKALELAEKAKKSNPARADILLLVLRCKDEICSYETPQEGAKILEQYAQLSLLEDIPDKFDTYQARAFAKNGELENSLELCEKIIEENRSNASVYRLLGLIKLVRNETEEAKNALQKAMGLEKHEPEAYKLLSYAFAQEGNTVEQVNYKAKYEELIDDKNTLLI